MTIIKEQITSLSKFLFEQSKSLGINTPFSKIYKEIEKNYCFYWYHYLNAQLEYMKYWQMKTKDLEILLIGLQSVIQSLNYLKKKADLNNNEIKYPDISATSVSEVTGIPRATCIRKLDWLCKAKFVKKDLSNKRYRLSYEKISENNLNHPLTNVNATVQIFTEFSLIIYKALNR